MFQCGTACLTTKQQTPLYKYTVSHLCVWKQQNLYITENNLRFKNKTCEGTMKWVMKSEELNYKFGVALEGHLFM